MRVLELSTDRRYWFIRTDGGYFFEEFIAKGIVAIDWNEVNDLELIKACGENDSELDEEQRKERAENIDRLVRLIQQKYPDETRPKYVARQIIQFVNEVREGDIVLIPSRNSWLITFGQVQSNDLVPMDEEGECDWEKRKKVDWIKTVERDKLDPFLFRLFYSQHAVTDANPYAAFIDRTLYPIFIKGNKAHLILDVRRSDGIPASSLASLIIGGLNLVETFAQETGTDLDKDSIEIRINVQSPGTIEFLGSIDPVLVLTIILAFIVGGNANINILGMCHWRY